MISSRVPAALAITALAWAIPLEAQDAPTKRCWRARPEPACSRFAVTDFSYLFTVLSSNAPADPFNRESVDFPRSLRWSIGVMRNAGAAARGPTVGLAWYVGRRGVTPSMEWRERRWLGRSSFVDLGAGYASKYVLVPSGDPTGVNERQLAHGATGGVSYGTEFVAVEARGDVVFSRDGARHGLSAGARAGGPAARWIAVVGGLLAIVHVSVAGN